MSHSNPTTPQTSPAGILDLGYLRAFEAGGKSLAGDPIIETDVEFVCRCSNLAGIRFLLACLTAKLSNSAFDIRKPYTEIGGEGTYSGRAYDEDFVAPFAFKYELPVNTTTSFLTPAFRTNKTAIEPGTELVGRPKQLYEKVVNLITAVHAGRVQPENLLAEIIRVLLMIRNERKQRLGSYLASLKTSQDDQPLSVENIVTLIRQHMALPRSARLPVLIVTAAYQVAETQLGERHLPLFGHTTADKQTRALGDIQISLKGENEIVTVYEMKAKRVTCEDIDVALWKLSPGNRIDNYLFITTDTVDNEVREYAKTLHSKTGVEFAVLDCLGFLQHFLYLFYRIRKQFLEAYQALVLAEPDSAVNPTLKEAFLSLRLAMEFGISQMPDDSTDD